MEVVQELFLVCFISLKFKSSAFKFKCTYFFFPFSALGRFWDFHYLFLSTLWSPSSLMIFVPFAPFWFVIENGEVRLPDVKYNFHLRYMYTYYF